MLNFLSKSGLLLRITDNAKVYDVVDTLMYEHFILPVNHVEVSNKQLKEIENMLKAKKYTKED